MFPKFAACLVVAGGIAAGPAFAQTGVAPTDASPAATPNAQPARSPTRGDPVAHTVHRRRHMPMPAADKQGPDTENGNQPDRAAAGGGGR